MPKQDSHSLHFRAHSKASVFLQLFYLEGREMTYTTAKAAEKIGISAHTLRFYDKEGLLPNVGRDGTR